ncbi:hypothetical protein ISS07_05020 [Candidatus Woesearchaeota archaeon]|nr:hypothetical protein [Candidatus Woesearchaeota archaeon]
MYELVEEGNAIIRIEKTSKISKEMEVFYNPLMEMNRSISILILNSIENKNMQIALPLAASGIRGIRFLKELEKGKIKTISFNDYDKKAINSIKNNFQLNKIKKFSLIKNNKESNSKIKLYSEDANLFLLNSKGFDYIDVDPFGSSDMFLDSAIKRISREGVLAVTNTDTAALSGTYPAVTKRKYWSSSKLDYMMHETGIRILIRKVQLIGMQYDKALIPVFPYYKDHYFRIFFKCVKGKKECDKLVKKHGMFKDSGPLWLGNLWDQKLAEKMHKLSTKNNKELFKFLKAIREESQIDTAGFYDLHKVAKERKIKDLIKKEDLIKKLKKKGYKASGTHFTGTGIRTNIEYKKFVKLF